MKYVVLETNHLQSRSTARSTNCKHPTLRCCRSTGRSTDRLGPVDRAVDGGTTIKNMTVGPVDRPVDQKGILAISVQMAIFLERLINSHLLGWFLQEFLELLFPIYKSFSASLKEFLWLKILSFYLFSRVVKSRKNRVFGKLILIFISIFF